MTHVMDASALLAVILNERGAEQVILPGRLLHISIVDLAEVFTKVVENGALIDDARAFVQTQPIRVRTFREDDAAEQARLRPLTRHLGLSFGDRVCLSLAVKSALPLLTADRDWAKLDLGLDIRLIR